MNCQACQNKLLAYVTDNLPDEERESIHHHIQSCEACQKDLKELKEIIFKIKNNRNNLPFPGTFMDEIQQKVHLSRRQKNKTKKPKRGLLIFCLGLLCIGIIVLSAMYVGFGDWLQKLIKYG